MSSSQDPEVLNFVVCDLCNYACSDKEELENHLKSHEENVKVETEVDIAGQNVEDALEDDFETHEEITKVEAEAGLEGQLVEDAMEESFEYDQDETKAKQSKDQTNSGHKVFKRFKCDLCDYSSDYSSNVNKHKKSVHDKIRLQCEDCEYTTTNYGILKKHMAQVHNKEKRGKRTKHVASQFLEPQPKVARRQSLKCDLCSFTTTLERRLTEHMDEAHPEQIEELAFEPLPLPFKCNECEYAAAVESYLMNHKKMLHEIVKEKCDKCEFEGKVRAEMMTHKLLTHGELIN